MKATTTWVSFNCKFSRTNRRAATRMRKNASFLFSLGRLLGKGAGYVAKAILEGVVGLAAGLTEIVARKMENLFERVKQAAWSVRLRAEWAIRKVFYFLSDSFTFRAMHLIGRLLIG